MLLLLIIITDSVRCVVGVRCQAITQLKQLFVGSVLGWVTAGARPAHRNAERAVIFPRLLDYTENSISLRQRYRTINLSKTYERYVYRY